MKQRCLAATTAILAIGICPAAWAATQEESLANVTMLIFYGSIACAIAVIASIYFMKSQDRRASPLTSVFAPGEAIHAVGANTVVSECVRLMTGRRIGALVVMEGEALRGIFTERDALTRVLAAGRDPSTVKVGEVMTRDPTVVGPQTSVREAMEMITTRRFRHLPVVDNGRLLAIVSSGDLTRWLVKDRMDEVQELVRLEA